MDISYLSQFFLDSFLYPLNEIGSMEKKFHFTAMKDYPLSLKAGLYYLLTLLGCMILLDIFSNDIIVNILVNVQEMGDPGVGYSFPFQVKNIVKIILLGLVHGTISYVVFKNLLMARLQTQNKKDTDQMKNVKNTTHIMEIILVWLICALIFGHAIHWLFDRANFLYREDWGDYNVNPSFLLLYFGDEDLSHGIIHTCYFFLLVFGVYCEAGLQKRRMHPDEFCIVIALAIGVVIVNGEAARIGESALPLLVLSVGAVIGIIIQKLRKNLALLDYPLVCTLLFGSIGVIIYDVIYVIINSYIPYYPFIT
jgi:hypothetical protein